MKKPNRVIRKIRFNIGGVAIVSALLFSCCGNRPEGVLNEEEMVGLMADMQLAEAYSNNVSYQNPNQRASLGKGVLEAHGVSQAELDSTLAWYGKNLDQYSDLYEKVDKEIAVRRKKLMKSEDPANYMNEADKLWPYVSHSELSDLGNTDAWIISIESPQLQNGDMIEWSARFKEYAQLSGVLGVEYSDGTSDANSQMLSGRNKFELRLQTDTGKVVKRIYGTIRLGDNGSKPIFADSIMLHRIPYDSIEYSRYGSLRHYGRPAKIKSNEILAGDSAQNKVEEVSKMMQNS